MISPPITLLALQTGDRLKFCQDFGAIFCDDDGMFILHTQFAVGRNNSPAIIQHKPFMAAGIDHRFNRKGHAGTQHWPTCRLPDM